MFQSFANVHAQSKQNTRVLITYDNGLLFTMASLADRFPCTAWLLRSIYTDSVYVDL